VNNIKLRHELYEIENVKWSGIDNGAQYILHLKKEEYKNCMNCAHDCNRK
jgi:hypothetical protein